MKTIKYLVPVLAVVLLFSCTGKNAEKTKEDITRQHTEEKQKKIEVPAYDFEGVQKLADPKTDTVYITNYWATWCSPCVMEIPHFVELQKEYKDQKVKFIFVNIEPESELETQVKPFVSKYGMENVYQMPAQEMKKFESFNPEFTQGIPVTLIQKGKEKEGVIGSMEKADLTQRIQKYLNRN